MDDKNSGKRRGLILFSFVICMANKPTSTKKIKGFPMTMFCSKNTQNFVRDQCNVTFFSITSFH